MRSNDLRANFNQNRFSERAPPIYNGLSQSNLPKPLFLEPRSRNSVQFQNPNPDLVRRHRSVEPNVLRGSQAGFTNKAMFRSPIVGSRIQTQNAISRQQPSFKVSNIQNQNIPVKGSQVFSEKNINSQNMQNQTSQMKLTRQL